MKHYLLTLLLFIVHCIAHAGFNSETFAISLLHTDTATIKQQLAALSRSSRANQALNKMVKAGIRHEKLKEDDQLTPLMIAAYKENKSVIREMINRNIPLDKQNNYGRTALMFAALGQHYRTITLLIECGANKNIHDFCDRDLKWYWSFKPQPFISAIIKNNSESIEFYMPNYQEVKSSEQVTVKILNRQYNNPKDETFTPLMAIAAQKIPLKRKSQRQHYVNLAGRFICMGADLNTQNNYGRTALMYAARAGNGLMIQALRENGAEPDIKDVDGKTFKEHGNKLLAQIESTAVNTTPETKRKYSHNPFDDSFF